MTNKGKVLVAVLVAVAVLAGGVGLYLKGGDLMGRIFIQKPVSRVVTNPEEFNVAAPCPADSVLYSTVSGKSALYGSDFESLYNALKNEVQSSSNKLVCPLKITMGSDEETSGYIVITKGSQLSFYDHADGSGSINFLRNIPGVSQHNVSFHPGSAIDPDYGTIQIYSRDLNNTYNLYTVKRGDISVERVSYPLY